MANIEIAWKRYRNFFSLWRRYEWNQKLFYVIGERHHCYIGSIGALGGKGGLHTRYQWQYLDRARAIFGLNEAQGQPCFAGIPTKPRKLTARQIHAIEANLQRRFIDVVGKKAALFKVISNVPALSIIHRGSAPRFLRLTSSNLLNSN